MQHAYTIPLPDETLRELWLISFQVPDNYLRAVFGSYLASRFVYEHGSSPSQFAFFDL